MTQLPGTGGDWFDMKNVVEVLAALNLYMTF
jgi:hypothetical protein